MSEIPELKPCPFCGGRAEQGKPEEPHGGMVHCISCGAVAFGPKWNRRATPMILPSEWTEAAVLTCEAVVLADFNHLTKDQSISGPEIVRRIMERFDVYCAQFIPKPVPTRSSDPFQSK